MERFEASPNTSPLYKARTEIQMAVALMGAPEKSDPSFNSYVFNNLERIRDDFRAVFEEFEKERPQIAEDWNDEGKRSEIISEIESRIARRKSLSEAA